MTADAFLSDERLQPVHEAVRALGGDRSKPKRVLLDWHYWASNKQGGSQTPCWIRSAEFEHKVMLIFAVSGSLQLKIAGYDHVNLKAKDAILCPAKLWMRALDTSQGHVLTLIYGPQVCYAPSDWRSTKVDSSDVPQPGVKAWLRRQGNQKVRKSGNRASTR